MKKTQYLILFFIILLLGYTSKKPSDKLQPSSIIGSCEKKIQLFEQKSKWVIENERAYIHFEYEDEYPSKKAFYYLEKKLLQCGWKLYEGDIEYLKGTADWMYFTRNVPDNKVDLIHQFGKSYTYNSNARIATILILYKSQSTEIEELMNLSEPNNNKQYITVQINRFDKKEYKKVMEEKLKNKKPKENK